MACGSWAAQSPKAQVPQSVTRDSFADEYDVKKPVVLLGAVTKLAWLNPHSWLYMDVKRSDGVVENWAVEIGSTKTLLRLGFTKDSLAPGTITKVKGFQAKDGALRTSGNDITWPDGRPLKTTLSSPTARVP